MKKMHMMPSGKIMQGPMMPGMMPTVGGKRRGRKAKNPKNFMKVKKMRRYPGEGGMPLAAEG